MGFEVDLPPGCMLDGDCIRTVPYSQRGGTFCNGRLNMQKWGCRESNKWETVINMGSERISSKDVCLSEVAPAQCRILNDALQYTTGD